MHSGTLRTWSPGAEVAHGIDGLVMKSSGNVLCGQPFISNWRRFTVRKIIIFSYVIPPSSSSGEGLHVHIIHLVVSEACRCRIFSYV